MDNEINVYLMDEALESWNLTHKNQINPIPHVQKYWDNIHIQLIIENDLNFSNPVDLARFLALNVQESGAWLNTIPSKNIGTVLDDQTIRTCVALRLGYEIYRKPLCHCGAPVGDNGRHGVSCPQSKGRIPRHYEINQIIHRALTSAHVASSLEPIGLNRDDGKRPDGITLVPWIKGEKMVWDATCVDTLAETYLPKTSKKAGSAAEIACKRKHDKYSQIKASNYIFLGLAFETMGPWANETKSFIDKIGDILIKESGDPRSKLYLQQRLSLAIQRGNSASILGTLPSSVPMEEIYML